MQSFWAGRKAKAFKHWHQQLLTTAWRPIIAAGSLALTLAGCATNPNDLISSLASSPPAAAKSEGDYRKYADNLGAMHRTNPRDPDLAIQYAQALRTLGQRPQAAAVLEQTLLAVPGNRALLGAYGRALADVGQYKQALEVLERAHTPENPDWRILSAQGAVLDQLGRHAEAQRYYSSALKIAPNEPSVLSNLGLSYALAKDLSKAETTLRRASSGQKIDPRVRQNLALVVGLQGRFPEAEEIAKADLLPGEAASNVAYLRQMLDQAKTGKKVVGRNSVTGS